MVEIFFIILLLLKNQNEKTFQTINDIYIQIIENNKNPRDVSNLNGAEKEEKKFKNQYQDTKKKFFIKGVGCK